MANGNSYAEALKEAQELGYAEADPTSDVGGFDALKVEILSTLAFQSVKEKIFKDMEWNISQVKN